MPSASDPKRSVRLAPEDLATLETASRLANVAVGALIRECVRRSAAEIAAEASAGRLKLRRRSAAVPVPSPAAPIDLSESIHELEPRAAFDPRGRRDAYPPGVQTARDLAFERQRKLNERRGS